MGDLIRMDSFRLRKSRLFIVVCITVFGVMFAMPLLTKGFVQLIVNMVQGGSGDASEREIEQLLYELSQPTALSGIIKSPFGGLSLITILVMISVVSFMYADHNNGYIKNIAGQVSSRGNLAVSKYLVTGMHNLILLVLGVLGGMLGTLISRGITFDEKMGEGILVFFIKFLLMWGLSAVLLLITNGLGNKTFAVVMAVIFGSGALLLVYMPLSFGLNKLFKTNNINIAAYAPDQLFLANEIDFLSGVTGAAVLIVLGVFFTVMLMNKKDVK